MLSRREFIKRATLATGGVLLTSSSFGNFSIAKAKVIVIGVGFAGYRQLIIYNGEAAAGKILINSHT